MIKPTLSVIAMAVLAAGCATAPLGPRVAVMPAPGKPFEQFQVDDQVCRQYADQSVGAGQQRVEDQAVATAVVGTAIGAVAGAAIGGHNGAAGAAIGSGQANAGSWDLQRRYDIAYQQCMYSRGNQLPGNYRRPPPPAPVSARPAYYPPPPSSVPGSAADIPPPPAGTPPPPPPGAR